MSSASTTTGIGRLTTVFLCFIVILCVAMIGGTGVLKYKLDRAQTILAAPDNALGSGQELMQKLRRDWGYGGFLGLAPKYATTHDANALAEMKEHIKSANDILSHLPDKTSAETRHELTSIGASYDVVLQKFIDNGSVDLTPLYAALPVLDARIDAATAEIRLAAQSRIQFWSMMLTLVSWASLIIAAGCAAGMYLTLRDKHSAPMRALTQSIQNMARGDMRTAIWGIERQDVIGELARAMDIARYHFSHLPDISVLSEEGPVRMRFEGGARSLFEAMMKAISTDSENIRTQSQTLNETVVQQKSSIDSLSKKVEAVLQNILNRGQTGEQQITKAISDMVGSAENLKNAHAHAADQLNRLIPHIQDRAQGLAEITQITGKQIAATLQSLTASEIGLKTNAEHAKETLTKLASTADDLGERLFGAINLLQASGKILTETANEVKATIGPDAVQHQVPTISLEPLSDQIEDIADFLSALQDKINAHFTSQEEHARVLETNLQERAEQTPETPTASPDEIIAPISSRLEDILGQLADVQNKIDTQSSMQMQLADRLTQDQGNEGTADEHVVIDALNELKDKIATLHTALSEDLRQSLQNNLSQIATQGDVSALDGKITDLVALNDRVAVFTSALPGDVRQALREELENKLPAQDDESALLAKTQEIAALISQLNDALPEHLNQALAQHNPMQPMEQALVDFGAKVDALSDLNNRVAVFTSALPGDVRQALREEMENTDKIESVQNAIAALHDKLADLTDLNGRVAVFTSALPGDMRQAVREEMEKNAPHDKIDALADKITELTNLNGRVAVFTSALPGDMRQALRDEVAVLRNDNTLDQISDRLAMLQENIIAALARTAGAAQMEAANNDIVQTIRQDVVGKLHVLEKLVADTRNISEQTQLEVIKPQAPVALSEETQRQLDEQWNQLAQRVEAARSATIESLNEQIAQMEARFVARSSISQTRSTADYAAQIQIEQQTQILSEIVATLGIIDEHMQQIKTGIAKS